MSSDLNLSQEEIEALRQGIADGSITSNAGVMPDGEVAPYVLGVGDDRGFGDLHAFHLLNERLARGLRQAFQPMLRVQPRVDAGSVTLESYENYADAFDAFLSLNTIRMEPLKGHGLVVFKPELVGALVDAYFGGKGVPPLSRLSEFTPAEDRVIQAVLDRIFEAMNGAWGDISPLKFSHVGSESHPQFFSFLEDRDMIVVTRFLVHLPRGLSSPIDIVYPLQSLKPLLPLLRMRVFTEQGQADPRWNRKLKTALLDVELPIRSILAEPTVPLSTIVALKPGDVIPITVPEELHMLVERTPFGIGAPGEANGNAALKIRAIAQPIAHTNR